MENTLEQLVTVASTSGLHARPAAVFVQNAKGFQCKVTLTKGDKTVNGKSILSVLSLGVSHGDQIKLQLSGSDAESALSNLSALLTQDLG